MESNEITEIRNRFQKETTLSHAGNNGHTQFYSEWLERELVQLQNTSSNSESTQCTEEVLKYIHYSIDSKAGRDIQNIIKKHFG